MKKCLFFILFLLPAFIFSVPLTKEAMLRDFEIIKNTYEVYYAPGDWKKEFCGWEMERAADESILLIKNMKRPSVKEYQHIVGSFLQSMNDVHVKGSFYSTEASMLPFTMRTAEGRFFISAVHHKLAEKYPDILHVGDEVISFDGLPVSFSLDEIIRWKNFDPRFPTHRSLATHFLTFAAASHDLKANEGVIEIEVRSGETGEVKDVKMEWTYQPERIWNGYLTDIKKEKVPSLFHVDMSDPFHKESLALQNQLMEQEFRCKDDNLQLLGSKKSFVPPLGDLLWESETKDFFHAYLFEKDGHKIGYIRIPHFSPASLKEEIDAIPEVEEFAKLIAYFEIHSEALVIDVVDNPGGAALFMYTLAAMLTDKPLTPPKFRHTMTQREILEAIVQSDELEEVTSDCEAREVLGETIQGYPVDFRLAQHLASHCRYLIDEWNAGKRITGYDYLLGMPTITPYPYIHYTKPILILTNELSVSCGDFFPAILQDNQRATLFGAKTAGAGGGVQMFSHPNPFGIVRYSCTCSIAERVDGEPIENLGVTPDISYEVGVNDLQGGYKGYIEAVNQAIEKVLYTETH